MDYVERVVLPSCKMRRKTTYTIPEILKILDIGRTTLYRKVKNGQIIMTKDKRIYHEELRNYFSDCESGECSPKHE